MLISYIYAYTGKLICAFAFAYADCFDFFLCCSSYKSVDYHKIIPLNKIYFTNLCFEIQSISKRPKFKTNSTKVALRSIILKKAATHIVTSHTYTTGSPEVRRTYAAGARYVDPWSQRIKLIQRMQGLERNSITHK